MKHRTNRPEYAPFFTFILGVLDEVEEGKLDPEDAMIKISGHYLDNRRAINDENTRMLMDGSPLFRDVEEVSKAIYLHIQADFDPDWASMASALMDRAGDILFKFRSIMVDRKPVAYLGREKHPTPGKDGPAVCLAFPDSPRSDLYEWTPLFDA